MVQTTATDLKANLGKYLVLVGREDIHITKNGVDVAVLTAPKSKLGWVEDLVGVIPNLDIDEKQIKVERVAQKCDPVGDQLSQLLEQTERLR